MFEFLFNIQENTSYSFIFYCYLICTSILLILIILDICLSIEIVQGFWIIFFPFIPLLIWAYIMKEKELILKLDTNKKIE
jgi:hypothetical protein